MYYVFAYIALFLGIIPLIVLFSKKRALVFKESIVPFIWLTAIATLYELTGTLTLKIPVGYWFQFYSLLEFLTIYYFFKKLFYVHYKNIFRVFITIFIIIYCSSFFIWKTHNIFIVEAINRIPLTLLVFTFSYIWFKELFQKMEIENPLDNSSFYFVSGLAIYYSGTTILFLLSSVVFESNSYFYDFWLVNVIATLFFRIFLIMGVWKMKQE